MGDLHIVGAGAVVVAVRPPEELRFCKDAGGARVADIKLGLGLQIATQ